MKKSYLKIIVFESLILLTTIINSFVSSILSKYVVSIFLIILITVFKTILGTEKTHHRRCKDMVYELFINYITFYLLYYLFGIFLGFYKSPNYYSLSGLSQFIIPIILNIILMEYLRYNVLCKTEKNKILTAITVLSFIFLSITTKLKINELRDSYDIFMFLAMNLLPCISANILCTYLSKKGGYIPSILARIFIEVPFYLLPIYPNPSNYIKAIIEFITPFVILYNIYNFLNKYEDKEINRDYRKKETSLFVFPTVLVIIIVYFVSGYFKYYAVAVASGSMLDIIDKGDVVIVEQIKKDYHRLEIGDIIAFKHNGTIIVHRLIRKTTDNKNYYFYTKGDANKEEDKFTIEESDIVGIVKFKINKIGYPTVWLNEI